MACPVGGTRPEGARAVALLALVAGQDVEPVDASDGTDGRWRIVQYVAPDRVISVVDPDAWHAHKTVSRRQDGFKAHLPATLNLRRLVNLGLICDHNGWALA